MKPITSYSEGPKIPKGAEFVQYDLDDQTGIATLSYEKRDGIALRVHTVKRDERCTPRETVLAKRPRTEMQLDALFLQLGPTSDGAMRTCMPRDMRLEPTV